MRAYYLGTGRNDQENPSNLLFVKAWARTHRHSEQKDEKLIALYHHQLLTAASSTPQAVYEILYALVDSSTGVTGLNVYHGIFDRMSPSEFKGFFEKERNEFDILIFVPKR